MDAEGGCYCGALRYRVEGKPMAKGECYCRACQHISGGSANLFVMMPATGFAWTQGEAATFKKDHEGAVTRHFCPRCGTQILTTRDDLPGMHIVKIGTLDEPALFGGAKMAIFTEDKQAFHRLSDAFPAFDQLPQ